MWKRINDVPDQDIEKNKIFIKDTSFFDEKMRYFIFYPPSQSIRLIDVGESVRVEDILELVKREFGLKIHDSDQAETSIVLSYNGFDLKPKWSLADLSIPSGAIIRCLYREQKAPDLYIHCGFNKQILKLFDSSISIETTIGTIRKKISDKLGLPLSTFCLETYDSQQRLYDEMKLINYDIKIHGHIYLKVWKGYEKFLSSCLKGFTEHYSHDDLIRHYQTQIALHIAAFYGHMELAHSVMQHGARSDRHVDDHPSRQWSSETTTKILPEMLKCPIHVAIERGHVKMVDLFVRQSVLCTQIRDPITGYLPYKLALSCTLSATSKEEKQRYNEIYFYLHDKQFNFKIPLNASGDYVSNLLTSTTSVNAVHRSSAHHVFVSLPFYCKIISWYERAREKAWKKFGGRFYTITQTKRVYPKNGLLGYKVLIDGYNNTFEVPTEQLRGVRSGDTLRADQGHRYAGFSVEEREKIIQMKSYMKQFALDERRRAKQIAAKQLQQSRRPPLLLPQTSSNLNKHPIATIQPIEGISSSSEFSNSQNLSNISAPDLKTFKSILDKNSSSIFNLLPPTLLTTTPTVIKQMDNHHKSIEKNKQTSKNVDKPLTSFQSPPIITVNDEDDQHTLRILVSPTSDAPTTHSTLTNKLETVANTHKQAFKPSMSSADAYLISSSRVALENEQRKVTKNRELFTKIEQTLQQQLKEATENSTNPLSTSLPVGRSSILDVDSYIALPDHPTNSRSGPIKSRLDLEIHQATVKSYERHASASTRSTAINCLQEAGYFKRKSWLKQVEISKEMIKHKVQRRIRRAVDEKTNKPTLVPLRATIPTTTTTTTTKTTSHKSNTIKVN